MPCWASKCSNSCRVPESGSRLTKQTLASSRLSTDVMPSGFVKPTDLCPVLHANYSSLVRKRVQFRPSAPVRDSHVSDNVILRNQSGKPYPFRQQHHDTSLAFATRFSSSKTASTRAAL